jgi:acyl carrier protein
MKLRDTAEWPQIRDQLRRAGVDPNVVADLGEVEGDSLDLVEAVMAVEEAYGLELEIDPGP